MAALTALLLLFAFVSAANSAATYLPREWRLEERVHVSWLPHSYDAPATWQSLWNYLALACVFWATHTWLGSASREDGSRRVSCPSVRLRLLVWVLAINAALLSLEAILQRTSGTPNLLWIQPTHDNKDATAQLGPFAYRANAAQYLNLIWPVALGLWWWLQREAWHSGRRRVAHHVLLPCVLVIAAACLYSLSRAGAAVTALLLGLCCAILAFRRSAPRSMRIGATLFGAGTLVAGLLISWSALSKRFVETAVDPLAGRAETYQLADQMARDYPWFGTGPGTFNHLFQVYRQTPEQYWPAQLHNDWLEMRITFGRVGMTLILAALALAMFRWLAPGGVPADDTFLLFTTIALAGCLAHARVDFPFQIYSIQFIFIVLAAIVFSSSREARRSRGKMS
jgi:O-antigen ligase